MVVSRQSWRPENCFPRHTLLKVVLPLAPYRTQVPGALGSGQLQLKQGGRNARANGECTRGTNTRGPALYD